MKIIEDLNAQVLSYYDNIVVLLPKFAMGIIVVLILWCLLRFIRRRIIKFTNYKADDKLLVNFLDGVLQTINIIFIFLIFLYVIGQSGIAASILGAATISSVVIGFAFKDIAENFLAGVIMAFNRPFRIGDTVMTESVEGNIVAMSLRDTHIKTFDGKDVYVPNGQIIKNPLYNYTIDGFLRKSFSVGLDYGTDVDEARNIIMGAMTKVPGILKDDKPPKTLIKELGSSSITVDIQYWVDTFDTKHSGTEIQSQAMKHVINDLDLAGVKMPGDIIELKNYDDGLKMKNENTVEGDKKTA